MIGVNGKADPVSRIGLRVDVIEINLKSIHENLNNLRRQISTNQIIVRKEMEKTLEELFEKLSAETKKNHADLIKQLCAETKKMHAMCSLSAFQLPAS